MITAKLQLLKDTFESKFDTDKFKRFTREFFNEPEMLSGKRHIGIWREYENSIISYSDIAKFKDAEGNNIIIFAVELKSEKGVERARSLQRNFISKILDDKNCEAAIVAFYSAEDVNWRLSFVRLDYTFKDKGLELDLTPARRYSYLVGENETSHTAQKQLYPIFEDDKHNPALDQIEAAFSVEKVTKDFFEQYKNKYYDLKEYLEKDEAFIKETFKLGFEVDKFSEQFAKKLMGQLAFLYFLQKKGWLGVKIVPKTILKKELVEIYNQSDKLKKDILKKVYKKYDEDVYKLNVNLIISKEFSQEEAEELSNIFIKNKKFDNEWGNGYKRFIRTVLWKHCEEHNKNLFDDYLEPFFYDALNKRRKNQYYKQFNCKIPFLNGGLFEPLEGYNWKEAKFQIPNNIFSNSSENGREADGILDIFDRYNFTMNEDEPLEKEVAVDPEMLGKIFENLLDGKDRKAKGAFYTPREIVHYMCQESLTNYLVNEVDVPYEDMKEFILYGELIRDADNRTNVGYSRELTIKQTVYDKIVQIDEALENIRVADPAVGSGAFPLGMLNEIVRARNNITEYLVRLDKIGKLDREYGEKYIRKLRSQYKMKWDTIKNSIFAVDIEPSAVDIAKLRLWLSVVVEQEIDEDNPEPHPLPNLDCNIMVGNSLIDEYEGIKLFDETLLHKHKNKLKEESQTHAQIASTMQLSMLIDYSDQWIKEMFELQDKLFDEDDEHKKKDIKAKIDKKRDDLIEYKLNRDGNREGLNKYKEMKKLKIKPFFIWELEFAKVFKEKGGFDIVVGNPPYVGEKGNKEIFRPIAKTEFGKKYYAGKADLFYYFFHKAIDVISLSGVVNFITTNYFITATGAKKLRKDIKERTTVIELINFNELKIFESAMGQHNIITLLRKKATNITAKTVSVQLNGSATDQMLKRILQGKDGNTVYNKVEQQQLYDGDELYIRLENSMNSSDETNKKQSILNKIASNKRLLGNIFDIHQGLKTNADKVSERYLKEHKYLLDVGVKKDDGIFVLPANDLLISTLNDYEKPFVKTLFKGSGIKKYATNSNSDQVVLFITRDNYINDKHENIKKHLDKFINIIKGRAEVEPNGSVLTYSITRPRDINMYNGSKIVVPYRSKYNIFGYNDISWYATSDVFYLNKKYGNDDIDIKYVLALLNSKLYYFWFYFRGKRKGEMLEFVKAPLSEVPIKIVSLEEQKKITNIVDEILSDNKVKEISELSTNYQNQIDKCIYELYELTGEEMKIINEFYFTKGGI